MLELRYLIRMIHLNLLINLSLQQTGHFVPKGPTIIGYNSVIQTHSVACL